MHLFKQRRYSQVGEAGAASDAAEPSKGASSNFWERWQSPAEAKYLLEKASSQHNQTYGSMAIVPRDNKVVHASKNDSSMTNTPSTSSSK